MKKLLKDAVHGIRKGLFALLPTGLLVLGAVAVSCGIGLIYVPAGIIASGVLMIVLGVLLILGGGDKS